MTQTRRPLDPSVYLAFVLFIMLGLPDGLLGLAWPSIRQEFNLGQDAQGMLLLAFVAGFITTSSMSGKVLERLNINRVLMIGFGIRSLATMLIFVAPSWEVVIALGFVLSLGTGMIDSSLNTYASTYDSSRLMNWLHACFGVGATIGPIIMTGLFDQGLKWQYGYLLAGAIQFSALVPIFLTARHWHDVNIEDEQGERTRTPLRSTLLLPVVWVGMSIFIFTTGSELTAANWGFTLFTEGRGINEETAGIVISIYWASFTIGRIIFGFIGDRWPEVWVVRYMAGLMVVGSTLVWLDLSHVITYLGLVAVGFGLAPVFPFIINSTAKRLSRRHAANAIGVQIAAAGLGGTMLPAIVGILAENIGVYTIAPALVFMCAGVFVMHELMVSMTSRQAALAEAVASTN